MVKGLQMFVFYIGKFLFHLFFDFFFFLILTLFVSYIVPCLHDQRPLSLVPALLA